MSSSGLSPQNPTKYVGPNVYLNIVVMRNREPTGADYRQPETGKLYAIDSYWIIGKDPTNGTEGDLWYLSKIVANVAYWLKLSNGGSGPLLGVTVPLGVSPIVPDGNGLMNFTSNASTLDITGSAASPNNNNINFDLPGGLNAVQQFTVQAATAPGVNPVTADANGNVTISGSAVVNHLVPVETHTRALNSYNVEVQYTASNVSALVTKNGLAHFDAAAFSVDPNTGFVSLSGGTGQIAITKVGVDTSSGTGTNPVVPTAAGLITVTGAQVATGIIGANVIRTDSTVANTYRIEIQQTAAVAAKDTTKNGVAHFDSANFNVDEGFVSLKTFPSNLVAFNAYVDVDTAPDKTGDGSEATMIADVEFFDIGSNYDNTTGIFTAPTTGLYSFCAHLNSFNLLTGMDSGQCYIVVSGNRFRFSDDNPFACRAGPGLGGTNALGRAGSVIAQMTAGDTAYVYFEISGSTKSAGIQGKNGNPQIRSWFCGKLLTAP